MNLATSAVVKTDNEMGWLQLKLDRSYTITKIVLYLWFYNHWYHPNHWCMLSVKEFEICQATRDNIDVAVYQGEVKVNSCGVVKLTSQLDQADQVYTVECGIEGDNVMVSKTEGLISIFEIAVFSGGSW